MPTPTPTTSSNISVSLRLDTLESASAENGCIDKFACFVTMTIPEPFNISFFPARAPVAIIPVRPFYTADNDYQATPPDEWPLDAIALFHANINESFVQSSRSGYATEDGLASGARVELWFHRSGGVDISTPEFSEEFSPDPTGKYIYHYSQTPGFSFKLRSYYQNGIDLASQPTYGLAETDTETLVSVACSSGGGGGGGGGGEGGGVCPCAPSRKPISCPGSQRTSVACVGAARRAVPLGNTLSSRKACG